MALLFRDKTECSICGDVIAEGEDAVFFPAFAVNELDPLIAFSDGAFHERCILAHPQRRTVEERVAEHFAKTGPGNRKCVVCGDDVTDITEHLEIGHLVDEPSDPLYPFNDTHLHRSCLGRWEERERFVQLLDDLRRSGRWSGPYLDILLAEIGG